MVRLGLEAAGAIPEATGVVRQRAGGTRGTVQDPDGAQDVSDLVPVRADVLALAGEVRDGVLKVFGVELGPEPELVNCEL